MNKGNIESGETGSGNSASGSHEPFFLKHGGVDARLWWSDKQHWWYFI